MKKKAKKAKRAKPARKDDVSTAVVWMAGALGDPAAWVPWEPDSQWPHNIRRKLQRKQRTLKAHLKYVERALVLLETSPEIEERLNVLNTALDSRIADNVAR